MPGKFASIAVGVLVGLSTNLTSISCAETSRQTSEAPAKTSAQTSAYSSLKNVRNAAVRIKRTILDLINDVTMRKMSDLEGDPIFFEPSDKQVEKDPSIYSKELSNWGSMGAYEAPRQSWLEADMKHLEQWIMALNDDMNAVPGEQQNAVGAAWQKMQAAAQDINASLMQLKALTRGPAYDNLAIAKSALAINDSLKQLEEPWKAAMKALKTK